MVFCVIFDCQVKTMRQPTSYPLDKFISPLSRFTRNDKYGAIVLGLSIVIALILANSPWHLYYRFFLDQEFGFYFEGKSYLKFTLTEWINDGLMALFFFVIGLELKKEIVAGELSDLKKSMLPFSAAVGGMVVPAFFYFLLNPSGTASAGWGIPMATDIALALGVLYLLGDRIPLAFKVFLTALAIVDDLGAVLVIAFFYTSHISLLNVGVGFGFLLLMFLGNRLGIRSIFYYAILGIGGVWLAFLLSGIHATIAAVLAAFMIPANVKIKEKIYIARIKKHLNRFIHTDPDDTIPTLTQRQMQIMEGIKLDTKRAMPPLQRLEHVLHPIVNFVILPVFALANAGVTLFDFEFSTFYSNNIAIGIMLGLLLGKPLGIFGFSWLVLKLKIASLPKEISLKNLPALGFLGSIGFTMSLFITQLAFASEVFKAEAKVGIFIASIMGGIIGYFILRKQTRKPGNEK